MLAAAYLKRTNDVPFARKVWPAVRAALDWMDTFGDADGDGFVEYRRGAEGGLPIKVGSDLKDLVFHADGELARGAIAMVEVQAYVVAAKRGASEIAKAIGEVAGAQDLANKADQLQIALDEHFWCEQSGLTRWRLTGKSGNALCAPLILGMCFFVAWLPPLGPWRLAAP